MRPIFYLLALGLQGLALGLQRLALCSRLGLALGLQGFSDNNMLVSLMQNAHVGGIGQHKPPTQAVLCHSGI